MDVFGGHEMGERKMSPSALPGSLEGCSQELADFQCLSFSYSETALCVKIKLELFVVAVMFSPAIIVYIIAILTIP